MILEGWYTNSHTGGVPRPGQRSGPIGVFCPFPIRAGPIRAGPIEAGPIGPAGQGRDQLGRWTVGGWLWEPTDEWG